MTFEFDEYLTDLIDEYVQEYRPLLLRGANGDWLFPGTTGGSKDPHLFGIQITERIQKATGLRITIHQFRHAAVAIYLKYHPGDYETVRRLLGHRNIRTTINFYCGGNHPGKPRVRQYRHVPFHDPHNRCHFRMRFINRHSCAITIPANKDSF